MRTLIAILLTFSVLAGSIHMDELVKLPVLLSHYYKHKSQNEAGTIFNFLYNHYVTNPKPDTLGDQNNHSGLPFKSTKIMQQHIGFFTHETTFALLTFHSVCQIAFPYTGTSIIPGFSTIWQPPKIN